MASIYDAFAKGRKARAKKEVKVETGKEKIEKRLAITGKYAKKAVEKPKEKPVKEMVVSQKTELEKPETRSQRKIRSRGYKDIGETKIASQKSKSSPLVERLRKEAANRKSKSSPLVERLRKERESKKRLSKK